MTPDRDWLLVAAGIAATVLLLAIVAAAIWSLT